MFNFLIYISLTTIVLSLCNAHTLRSILPKNDRVRIVGGAMAKARDFPWQAAVSGCSGGVCQICGGGLIATNIVLTAAHCTVGMKYFSIGLGSGEWFNPLESILATEKIEHPLYDPKLLENDIAILKLTKEVTLSNTIQLIKLPNKNIGNLVDKHVLISGYGKMGDNVVSIPTFKWLEMKVITNEKCAKTYGDIIPGLMCTVAVTGKDNICEGDSGGPLVLEDKNSHILVGIVSFGSSSSCENGSPSAFTRVSSYLDWIQMNTGISV